MDKIKDTKLGAWLKSKAPNVLETVGDLLIVTGKLVNEEIDKLLKPAQKFENYINNVMLAEDALAKDFINPREHVAKKFGISYDSEQIKNFFRR